MTRLTLLALLTLSLTWTSSALAQSRAQSNGDARQAQIDVVFVLDTTGSMGGLIEGAKKKIWSIASKIASAKPSPKLRVGLVGYRDKGDAYVTRITDLSDDLDKVYGQLQAFRAAGGGDSPEHVGRALGEAVSKITWSQHSRTMKMIFLVGDAPPHVYQDGWNYQTWAKRAVEKDVIVNTIRCGNNAAAGTAFKEIAQLARGSFTTIAASGGMVAVHTPYDKKIETLNRKLAETSLYGGIGRIAAQRKAKKVSSMRGEVAANRVKYKIAKNSKPGRGTPAPILDTRGDGYTDLAAAPEALESMKASELPTALKGLDKAAQRAHVRKLSKRQKALAKKLAKLSKKRDAYIAKEVSEKGDSFDAQVMSDIKKQAKSYGLSF